MASAIATRRLRKELLHLQKDPPPGIIAEPQEHDILTWFFALRGPSNTPYHGGVYIGKLVFPTAYPMKAPRILMLTPSARFVVNARICMSMSDFHPELWNPSWSVATILTGVVSFMTSEEVTTGGITASDDERKRLAKESMDYNKKNYSHLFQGGDLMAALDRADVARELAEKERIATLVKKTTNSKATTAVQQSSSQQQEQMKQNDNEQKDGQQQQQQQQQQQHNEQSSKKETELTTPEEAEKRRLKNAKKRAKQKVKKQQAAVAGVDNDVDDDDANIEEQEEESVSAAAAAAATGIGSL